MKLMLIGGGEVGRGNSDYETKEIDEEIVKMTNKETPNFLFIGLASSFSDSYYDTMKKIYSSLGCNCAYLKKKNIINNRNIVEEKIANADIIYMCGGDTIKLVNDLKTYNLESLLFQAAKENKVLAGISAGAIALSKKGYSDSLKLRGESDKYEFIDGLGIINVIFSPHHKADSDKESELLRDIKDEIVYALEDNTALKIIDQKYEIIKSNRNNKGFLITKEHKVLLEDKGIIEE